MLMLISSMRCRDFNRRGALSILLFLPVINVFLLLILMLLPGNKHDNRFGPSPDKASLLTRMLGVYVPLLLVVATGVATYFYWSQVEMSLREQLAKLSVFSGFSLPDSW